MEQKARREAYSKAEAKAKALRQEAVLKGITATKRVDPGMHPRPSSPKCCRPEGCFRSILDTGKNKLDLSSSISPSPHPVSHEENRGHHHTGVQRGRQGQQAAK